jgi:hypothetical protein
VLPILAPIEMPKAVFPDTKSALFGPKSAIMVKSGAAGFGATTALVARNFVSEAESQDEQREACPPRA